MHKFDYSFLDNGLLPTGILNLTSTISALKALATERRDKNLQIYTQLESIARVQSVKNSNAIEGIVTTDARIKEIVDGNSAPLNHVQSSCEWEGNALKKAQAESAMSFR